MRMRSFPLRLDLKRLWGCLRILRGAGGTRCNLTNPEQCAVRALNASSPPTGVTGKLCRFFFGPFRIVWFLWKSGNFRISPGLKKRAHVPSKSRFTATEVETVLDYRSLDFLHFWWFSVIFAKLGIGKNKRCLTWKWQTTPNSGT